MGGQAVGEIRAVTALLLDTHAALFWWSGAASLSRAAHEAITAPAAPIAVSAASAWEIATKFRIRKLDFAGDPIIYFPRLMRRDGFALVAITADHGLRASMLDGVHRDPFDRIIAAQALIEDMMIVTRDPVFAAFGCKVLW